MNTVIKIVLIVIGIIVVLLFASNWYNQKTCPVVKEECLKRIIYDPDKKAHRWSEFSNEWFQNKEDALKNCFIVNKNLFCH